MGSIPEFLNFPESVLRLDVLEVCRAPALHGLELSDPNVIRQTVPEFAVSGQPG
jgi:hypothetical protein